MIADISVVVPIYNVEKYIEDAIVSLLVQTKTNFEVIVVDDGAVDRSIAIAKGLVKGDTRFKFVCQPNSGLGAARMAGVRHAAADYVMFFDSDDRLRPDALEALFLAAQSFDADIVSGRFERISELGEPDSVVTDNLAQHQVPQMAGPLPSWQAVLGAFAPSISCARLYSRELLDGLAPMFPARLPHEDLFFTYKALLSCRRHHALDSIVYQYRQRQGSLSKAISIAHVESLFSQIDDVSQYFDAHPEYADLAAPFAARRTLILLHGIMARLKGAEEAATRFFDEQIEIRSSVLIEQLNTFKRSKIKESFVPPQSVKYVEELQRKGDLMSRRAKGSSVGIAIEAFDTYQAREAMEINRGDRKNLQSFHNKFRGKRAFIVGNGPSLNMHDLSLLNGEYVFGVNSIFLKSRDTDFAPTFFVVEDSKVYEENAAEIAAYDVPFKFFPVDYREKYGVVKDAYYFQMNQGFYLSNSPNYGVPRFSTDMSRELFCGQTVTYLNLQIAFYMGFEEVYLIGMDFNYTIPDAHVRKGNHILSTTDDPNHFHKDYFGVGKTWKDPKLDRVAMNYRQAKLAYEAVGRKIFNATNGGKLEIFDRVDYEALLRDHETGRKLHGGALADNSRLIEPHSVSTARASLVQGPTEPASPPAAEAVQVAVDVAAAGAKRDVAIVTTIDVASDSMNDPVEASTTVHDAGRPGSGPEMDTERAQEAVLSQALTSIWSRTRRLAGAAPVWIVGLWVLIALSVATFGPDSLMPRTMLAAAVLGTGFVAGLGALGWRLRRHIQTLSAENRKLVARISRIYELENGRDTRIERLAGEKRGLDQRIALLDATQRRGARALEDRIAALEAELRRRSADVDVRAEISSLEVRVAETSAAAVAQLQAELAGVHSRLDQKITVRATSTSASFGRASQAAKRREAELQARIEVLANRLETISSEQRGAAEQASSHDERVREELAMAVIGIRAEIEGLESRLKLQAAEGDNAVEVRLEELQQRVNAVLQDQARLLEEAGAQAAGNDERVRKELEGAIVGLRTDVKAFEALQDDKAAAFMAEGAALHGELEALRKASSDADGALGKTLQGVSSRLKKAEDHSVSLHVTSALRALRPLWTGGSAVEALKSQASVEHGHELMMAVLADQEKTSPGILNGKTLIEIGTTRENSPAQSSTQKLGVFAALTGLRFITVDMDPENTNAASSILRFINPAAQAFTSKGEVYLRQHAAPLEYIYLDAFDFYHENHSGERKSRYRKYLGAEISDPACWKMHEECAETIIARMVDGGVVVLDDTWTDENGRYAGKGKLAAPLLIDNGFTVIARTGQTVAMRRGKV